MSGDGPLRLPRRELLRIGGWGAFGLTTTVILGACSPLVRNAAAGGPASVVLPFNDGWLFGPYSAASMAPSFDDSSFTPVTAPHCVTPLSWRDWDPSTWQQQYTYRRHFSVPSAFGGLRVFADFSGVMVNATPAINGHQLSLHQGGYLPFSYELTTQLESGKQNVLAVLDDSQWLYVPPEGAAGGPRSIDYLQPGGLYRDVALRGVPQTFIANVFAKPINVLTSRAAVDMVCTVDSGPRGHDGSGDLLVQVRSVRDNALVGSGKGRIVLTRGKQTTASFSIDVHGFDLWSPDLPNLYYVNTTLQVGGHAVHGYQSRIGFREASFQVDGFFLNGSRLKLFGLNRHQIYPYTGMAMPARVQRKDAEILRQDLNCNMVRCSHYPQSPHFLDACDELGLMVWEETPGWGFVGDATWQAICVQNVHDMIIRDRNRPSIIIWGTRVNEAPNIVPLWAQTRALCKQLDGSRPSSGTMTHHDTTDWAEDVFAMDDYSYDAAGAFLMPPIPGVPYLVTESVGALDPPHYYLRTVSQHDQSQQAYLHGQAHSAAGANNAYCGLLGWCGFDYDSLNGYIRYDIKWPGVCDTFRVPKLGAAIYQAQCDPKVRPVIQPAFYWDFGPTSPVTSLGPLAVIWSNCDQIEAYVAGTKIATMSPATAFFDGLDHPPFFLDVSSVDGGSHPELRLDGYVGGKLVLSRTFSSDPSTDWLLVTADDPEITADGSDATRVVFRAVDTYGAPRPYVSGSATVTLTGPAVLVGETTFAFDIAGGVGACWVRSMPGKTGTATVGVTHPTLGSGSASVAISAATGSTVRV